MTKLYHAPIEVETTDDQPLRFKWRNRWRDIKTVYEHSVVQAEWWKQEVNRTNYSIQCEGLEEFDIYRQGDRWFLERVWD
jgi:hypothetical protein